MGDLDGRAVVICGATTRIGAALARRVGALGASVVPVPPPERRAGATGAAAALPGDRPVALAVFTHVEPDSLRATPLVRLDEAGWDRCAEAPVRAFCWFAQAMHPVLRAAGGALVLVAPSVSQEGGAGLVALATAVEGQRALAKSAARQWGDDVPVLVVAPRLDALADVPADGSWADALRTAPATSPPCRSADAVADAIVRVAVPPLAGATGSTIGLDGGALMRP